MNTDPKKKKKVSKKGLTLSAGVHTVLGVDLKMISIAIMQSYVSECKHSVACNSCINTQTYP